MATRLSTVPHVSISCLAVIEAYDIIQTLVAEAEISLQLSLTLPDLDGPVRELGVPHGNAVPAPQASHA